MVAVEADRYHRRHTACELAIRDLKHSAGLAHLPSAGFAANAAWLICAALAHNLHRWIALLGRTLEFLPVAGHFHSERRRVDHLGSDVSTCWPLHRACRSPGRSLRPKQTNATFCLDMLAHSGLARPGQTIIADKGYRRAGFEEALNQAGMTLIRPATKTEAPRPGRRFLRPFRQIIESVNNTLKTQLDLDRNGGRIKPGVIAHILQRLLALTTAIWHNQTTNRLGPARSLIAYDH